MQTPQRSAPFPYTTLFRSRLPASSRDRQTGLLPRLQPATEIEDALAPGLLELLRRARRPGPVRAAKQHQIGRASCRERVEISVVDGALKKKAEQQSRDIRV